MTRASDAALLTGHGRALRALAFSLLRDHAAADDVLQETYVRALAAPPELRQGLGGWLACVVRGLAINRLRGESRRRAREHSWAAQRAEHSTAPEDVPSTLARAETLQATVAELLALDEPYREALFLRYFEGLSPAAIAERLGVPRRTVASRLSRGLSRLRGALGARFERSARWPERNESGPGEREAPERRDPDLFERRMSAFLGLSWPLELAPAGPPVATVRHAARPAATASKSKAPHAAGPRSTPWAHGTPWIGASIMASKSKLAGVAAASLAAVWFATTRDSAARPVSAPSDASGQPVAAMPASPDLALRTPTSEPRDAREPAVPQADSTPAQPASGARPPALPGPHRFEFSVVAVDAAGRPVSDARVRLAQPGGALVGAGSTDLDGALRLDFRGAQSRCALCVEVSSDNQRDRVLRRVELRTDAPATLQVVLGMDPRASALSSVFIGETRALLVSGAFLSVGRASVFGSHLSSLDASTSSFSVDDAGNGVFVDPWLAGGASPRYGVVGQGSGLGGAILAMDFYRRGLDVNHSLSLSADGLRTAGLALDVDVQGVPLPADASARIDVRVLDPTGRPAAGVPLFARVGQTVRSVDCDEDGACSLEGMPAGTCELVAGSLAWGCARRSLPIESGTTAYAELTLDARPAWRGRLVDLEGRGLAGWTIELRERGRPPTLLGSVGLGCTTTDDAGRVALRGLDGDPEVVVVRPPGADQTPGACVEFTAVADGAGMVGGVGSELVARLDDRGSRVRLEIEVPSWGASTGWDPSHVAARLWRLDSGDGCTFRALDQTDPSAALELECAGLLAGDYEVEVSAAGAGPLSLGIVHLKAGESLDLGAIALRESPPLQLDWTSASGAPSQVLALTLETRREGLIARTPQLGVSVPATLRFPAGPARLERQGVLPADARAARAPMEFEVDAVAGARVELEPDAHASPSEEPSPPERSADAPTDSETRADAEPVDTATTGGLERG